MQKYNSHKIRLNHMSEIVLKVPDNALLAMKMSPDEKRESELDYSYKD